IHPITTGGMESQIRTQNHGVFRTLQVSAAQKHYSAQFSTVVSNAPYTVSAQQLVKTNDVFLLHHDELLSFSKK
ncbi:hypothetical protein ACJROZ_15530, partial [Acetobacter indonesiensis]